jgi:pyruvate dehydrogenase E2 component (dihydrolipoamide acetyltransferase)
MAELIKMPRLSDTMEEGTVACSVKKVGDSVIEFGFTGIAFA